MKRYFAEYEKTLNAEFVHPQTGENTTLRKCIHIQAERLAATIQKGAEYVPYQLRN
jgi:CRISPR/Cas system-associated endonuclease Cas1